MNENEELRMFVSEVIKKLVLAKDLDNLRLLLGDIERAEEKVRTELFKDN